jgi:hypothetical protein
MQHLDLEQLARLVDEAPEPHEAEHLRGCLVCRRELAEMRAQTDALATLDEVDPPGHAWAELETRLADEGLIRTPAAPRNRVLGLYRPPMRIAAAIALFLLGGAAGAAALRGSSAHGRVAAGDAPTAESGRPSSRPSRLLDPEILFVGETSPAAASTTGGSGNGARLAANGGTQARRPARVVPPRRTAPVRASRAEADRAARELVRAQADYVGALQRVAAIADPASGNTPETRLAALEQLVELTAQALERVPGDPVINGYHLAAVAERDALRRELDRDAQTAWF